MQSQAISSTRKRHRTQAWSRQIRSTLAIRALSQLELAQNIHLPHSQVRQAISQGVYPGTIRAIEKFLGIVPKTTHIAPGAPRTTSTSSTAANSRHS